VTILEKKRRGFTTEHTEDTERRGKSQEGRTGEGKEERVSSADRSSVLTFFLHIFSDALRSQVARLP
jgi:hypothetical protein